MALKRNIPEEYMDYDYGFTGVSEEEYRKKETEADLKVSQAEKDAAQKLREASLKTVSYTNLTLPTIYSV